MQPGIERFESRGIRMASRPRREVPIGSNALFGLRCWPVQGPARDLQRRLTPPPPPESASAPWRATG
jgi:hypothetical protein